MAKNDPKVEETKTEETKTEEVEEVKDTRVDVFIPKGYANEDPNMFVSVNGVNYLLPRGKTSKVPPEVAEEIKRAFKAQEAMDAHIDEMLEASK